MTLEEFEYVRRGIDPKKLAYVTHWANSNSIPTRLTLVLTNMNRGLVNPLIIQQLPRLKTKTVSVSEA